MKKIISLILAITLVIIMSGCGSKWSNKENDTVSVMDGGTVYTQYYVDENYYTQEEVDEMFTNIMEIHLLTNNKVIEYEQRIEELETQEITYTNCNMIQLLFEYQEALDTYYTFYIIDGELLEYRDGELGDTFTNEDLLDEYCEVD